MVIEELKCLNREQPIGIGDHPHFSWIMKSQEQNTMQTAYRILIRDEKEQVFWDSGKEDSRKSTYISYEGQPLKSHSRYFWKVTVWDNHGNMAENEDFFETGLLQKEYWQAKWVVSKISKKKDKAAILFRRKVSLTNSVKNARIYATCHGIYHLYVNGSRGDDREFAPEFTVYEKYLCVQTYDVTELLQSGDNVIGMEVADGWYRCPTTKQSYRGYDPHHAILWQLEVTYQDGSRETFGSDAKVMERKSAIMRADLFDGETYDANLEIKNWCRTDCSMDGWSPAKTGNFGYNNLKMQDGEPIRSVRTLPLAYILHTPKGETVLDLGQNIAGRLRLRIHVPKGQKVTLEHSEILDKAGNFFNNIQGINQHDEFISSGEEVIFEPKYTFHGFRYVRVCGLDAIRESDVQAVVIATDAAWIGDFTCSDARINRLIENTRWSQKSNMVSIPTDCPQREKMGWTGDVTVYAKTALANQDLTGLLTRWLDNMRLNQQKDGQIPSVVPNPDFFKMVAKMTNMMLGGSFSEIASSGWGDAAVVVPYMLYQATGNAEILKEQYGSMKAWVSYMQKQAETRQPKERRQDPETEKYLWDTGFHYGEWLIPSATQKGSMSAAVKKSAKDGRFYIAPVYYYMSCKMLSEAAAVIGQTQDAKIYHALSEKIKSAYQKSMVNTDGTLQIDVQGAYVLALHAGLLPDGLEQKAADRLADLIHQNDDRLDVGFLATPFLLDVLCDHGHRNLAYRLLYQNKRPSWMYEVEAGATTIWENWNCEDEKGDVQVISMNHYAFGCVADWIYRYIGGISYDAPGYQHFIVEPKPDQSLSFGKRSYLSPYGMIQSEWKRQDGQFILEVQVPCNTQATIILPDQSRHTCGSGQYRFTCQDKCD